MLPHMLKVGKEAGIKFDYGGAIGNTFNSHRLIDWAMQKGGHVLQNQLVEELFKAYFEEKKDISINETLISCGVKT